MAAPAGHMTLQKLLLIRAVRPDLLLHALHALLKTYLGDEFLLPPGTGGGMALQRVKAANPQTPLVLLTEKVDPLRVLM